MSDVAFHDIIDVFPCCHVSGVRWMKRLSFTPIQHSTRSFSPNVLQPFNMSSSILFILTSADKALDGKPIGYYLPEIAHPFAALKDHFKIVAASPKGGKAPVDQSSVENFKDDESVHFHNSPETQKLVNETLKISEVKASDYAAVFVVGGVRMALDHKSRAND